MARQTASSFVRVARVEEPLGADDLNNLCDATREAITAGGGFGWLKAPPTHILERYWRGVALIPERSLFVGWLDNTACAAAQLIKPFRNNEAQAHSVSITGAFVAPWAREHGVARHLMMAMEIYAKRDGFKVIHLDVRETQTAAIKLYQRLGYHCWAKNPYYAFVEGDYIGGLYFHKLLSHEEMVPPNLEAPLT
jgi:ribosomal protein S18 acetylase RimI-like enzyme